MEQKRVAPYADAFRQQMVELVVAGRRPMELAREFGCSDGSIHAWVKKAGRVVDLPRGAQAAIGHSSQRSGMPVHQRRVWQALQRVKRAPVDGVA